MIVSDTPTSDPTLHTVLSSSSCGGTMRYDRISEGRDDRGSSTLTSIDDPKSEELPKVSMLCSIV